MSSMAKAGELIHKAAQESSQQQTSADTTSQSQNNNENVVDADYKVKEDDKPS